MLETASGGQSGHFADLDAVAVHIRNRGVIGNAERRPPLQHALWLFPARLQRRAIRPVMPTWTQMARSNGANVVERPGCRPGFEPLLVESGDPAGYSEGPRLFKSVSQVVLDGYHGTKPSRKRLSAYRALRARAVMEGRTVGALIAEAIRGYLARPASLRTSSLRLLRPEAYPPGSDQLGTQIDQLLYGHRC
jgi:hypothetical protein